MPPVDMPAAVGLKVHIPKLALPSAIGSPVALPHPHPSPSAESGSEISITSLQVRVACALQAVPCPCIRLPKLEQHTMPKCPVLCRSAVCPTSLQLGWELMLTLRKGPALQPHMPQNPSSISHSMSRCSHGRWLAGCQSALCMLIKVRGETAGQIACLP